MHYFYQGLFSFPGQFRPALTSFLWSHPELRDWLQAHYQEERKFITERKTAIVPTHTPLKINLDLIIPAEKLARMTYSLKV